MANQRWILNFMDDQPASGRRFPVCNVVDDVTRECLTEARGTSISGELSELIAQRGKHGGFRGETG